MFFSLHTMFQPGRHPMTISRLHELFALGLMFIAGYACMVVG